MIGKAGIVALAVAPVFGATHTADLRELYNEMYPVNHLKRDAFNLCHESDANFVRALQADRESCYDRMPHSIALAIGRVRPGNELAMMPDLDDPGRAALLLADIATLPLRDLPGAPRHLALLAEARDPAASGCDEAPALAAAAPAAPVAGLLGRTAVAAGQAHRFPVLSASMTIEPAALQALTPLTVAVSPDAGLLSQGLQAGPQAPAAAAVRACPARA
ncbi:MAG: hypothetical protein JO267_03700 [Alphaproteobacteria bacterium]|nr:hypothetical protein [Alphaproteobacteria bacterium]